jgi:hypothetical protein
MKRNMDLARQILLEVERQPYTGMPIDLKIEDQDPADVEYHVLLLAEAGLLDQAKRQTLNSRTRPTRLTWEGHEFLDAARDPGIWDKFTAAVRPIGGVTFPIAVSVLTELTKAELRRRGVLP